MDLKKNILNLLILLLLLIFLYSSYLLIIQNKTNKIVVDDLSTILDTSPNSRYETVQKDTMIYDSISSSFVKRTITIYEPVKFITIENLWQDFTIQIEYPYIIESNKMTDIILTIRKKNITNKVPLEITAQLNILDGLFVIIDSTNNTKKVIDENEWLWTKIFKEDLGLEVSIYDSRSDLTFLQKIPIKIYKSHSNLVLTFMQENTWLSWFLGGFISTCLIIFNFFKPKGRQPYS